MSFIIIRQAKRDFFDQPTVVTIHQGRPTFVTKYTGTYAEAVRIADGLRKQFGEEHTYTILPYSPIAG